MTGIYYADMADVLTDAGVPVTVLAVQQGWERRARSSGGFPAPPLGLWWHHTVSSTSPANDLQWMIVGCPDAPVGNLLLGRDGVAYPIAAGASNCAGKGGPYTFSRGPVPADQGNTRGWQVEIANNGVGEQYPTRQIDAMFRVSNALNARAGNLPTDVITHQVWAPTRKIDPATAAAVLGGWRPRSINSSGSWSLPDIAAECLARASSTPPPTGDDMTPEQAQQLNDVYYWLRQLVTEQGWPNVPVYPASLAELVDERIAASDLYGKVIDVWYRVNQLVTEVDWPNLPAYRQSFVNLAAELAGDGPPRSGH